jgi:hypothetical protein
VRVVQNCSKSLFAVEEFSSSVERYRKSLFAKAFRAEDLTVPPFARAHNSQVRSYVLKKAIALDDHPISFNSFKGFINSAFNLIIFYDYPMHIRSAGIPEAPGVLVSLVIGFSARTNYRLVAEQIADAATRRISAT